MKKLLLIDADSTIPNLALMKLSSFYKNKDFFIKLKKLRLPYFPNRKKIKHYINTNGYDLVFCSVIFEGNKEYVIGDNINFGGTGYSLSKTLPDEIENCLPDYSIYPENNISYGFITRGCIRNCYFCKVPKKEGNIRKVQEIENIIQHKKVKFMDNNILAYKYHEEELKKLIKLKVKCQFNQGLDIRLVNKNNSVLLSQLNYMQEYIFAFDDIKYKDNISKKLELLNWRKDWQIKFFVYINPNMPLKDTIDRIKWLYDNRCLPYIMRDISCWKSVNSDFYIDIAAWCNQPNLFKYMSFEEFLNKRHKNKNRIMHSLQLWNCE